MGESGSTAIGAAFFSVVFAICISMLAALFFLFHEYQALFQAVRTGAKYAAVRGRIDDEVEEAIAATLSAAGISVEAVSITGTRSSQPFGSPIEVCLEYYRTLRVFKTSPGLRLFSRPYGLNLRAKALTTSEFIPVEGR